MYSAFSTFRLNPTISFEPGSASMMYHISVFPRELCLALAKRSSGCSCMDRTCALPIYLIRMGNSFPKRSVTSLPNTASGSRSINSSREVPFKGPLETSEISPFTPESSQLSPLISLSMGLPNTSLSLVPPQRRSLSMGLNFKGYRSILSVIGYKISWGLVEDHLQFLGPVYMWSEFVPDHHGDVLRGRVELLELRNVQIKVLVIQGFLDLFTDQILQHLEIHDKTGILIDFSPDADDQVVILSVVTGIVALSEDHPVFLLVPVVPVQPMGRIEIGLPTYFDFHAVLPFVLIWS